MKKKVILFGLGDFSRIAFLYLQRSPEFEVIAFTVHSQFIQAPLFMDKPVVPFETIENDFPVSDFCMFVAIGFKNLNKEEVKSTTNVNAKVMN